jgi:hypothetical protein
MGDSGDVAQGPSQLIQAELTYRLDLSSHGITERFAREAIE